MKKTKIYIWKTKIIKIKLHFAINSKFEFFHLFSTFTLLNIQEEIFSIKIKKRKRVKYYMKLLHVTGHTIYCIYDFFFLWRISVYQISLSTTEVLKTFCDLLILSSMGASSFQPSGRVDDEPNKRLYDQSDTFANEWPRQNGAQVQDQWPRVRARVVLRLQELHLLSHPNRGHRRSQTRSPCGVLHRSTDDVFAAARLQSVRRERYTLSAHVDSDSSHHRPRTPHPHQAHLVRAISDAVQHLPSTWRRPKHSRCCRSAFQSVHIRLGHRHQLLVLARHLCQGVHAALEQWDMRLPGIWQLPTRRR